VPGTFGAMRGQPEAGPAVEVEALSKTFRLPQERVHTLKERALHPLRRTRWDVLRALREVSFAVEPGEFFGIMGRNGSGKSTLLKCIAGIYRADAGRILLRGRMSPFIELGVGFNPDLPARDNVQINAIMLGLSPAEARARFESVVEYAELEDFVDLKLKNYSSGMHVRLAFAVMVQVDADILLIDEVLAVGDAAFQQKCHETLHQRRQEGKTILFVTHDMNTIEQVCDRAMLLEHGRVLDVAEPRRIARGYNEINFRGAAGAPGRVGAGRAGDGGAAILDAWFEDAAGRRVPVLEQGRPCSFHALVEMRAPASRPVLGFVLADEQHRRIFATTTAWSGTDTGDFQAGERVEMAVSFDCVLAPGRYFASPMVSHEGTGARVMDLREELVSVVVTGSRRGGIVELPHEISLRREVGELAAPGAR
jgi:ABC-type polysaccharide/polyol phosphate transport system ATPase subunit